MIVVAQLAALVAAAVHLLVFVWETILFRRPSIHRDVFRIPTEDVQPVRMWRSTSASTTSSSDPERSPA